MGIKEDVQVFAGCANFFLRRHFLPNACIAGTAITIEVMSHFGYPSEPWETCLKVDGDGCHLNVGCFEPSDEHSVGGHLVAVVKRAFVVDASFAQVRVACPGLSSP